MKSIRLIEYKILGIPAGLTIRFLCGIFSLYALLLIFTAAVGHEIRLKYEVIGFMGDSVLMMSPLFLLPRRWRWTAIIPVVLLALYLIASEIYYRYWGDFLPLTSVFTSANWNGFVAGSVPRMFNLLDCVMLLVPILYGVGLYLLGKADAKTGEHVSPRCRVVAFLCSVLFWAMTFMVSLFQERGYLRSIDADSSPRAVLASRMQSASSLYGNWHCGLPVYFYLEIRNLLEGGGRHRLSAEERAFVEKVLYHGTSPLKEEYSSAFAANRDKNLIFIIVESLNADIVGKKYAGRSVTPVLDSLTNTPGTVAALNITAQIGAGGSSDGQLIYNTGLLPVFHGCTAQLYGSSVTFPSLVKSLRKKSAREYIVEEGRVWFHTSTSRAYGYERLNDAAKLDSLGFDPAKLGGDRAVFAMALEELPVLPRPFMAEIVTLSMHFPYNDAGVPRKGWIDSLEGIEDSERNYLQMTNYFDSELGRFLRRLKEEGLYDSSVIVLASDHDQLYKNVTDVASSKNASPIVFMALNTGETARIDRPAWQMDVYPTVLDIMDYDGSGYRGIGHSLLREGDRADSLSVEERGRASDLIIRSDYFGIGSDGGH